MDNRFNHRNLDRLKDHPSNHLGLNRDLHKDLLNNNKEGLHNNNRDRAKDQARDQARQILEDDIMIIWIVFDNYIIAFDLLVIYCKLWIIINSCM